MLSVIVPTLNEAANLTACLAPLQTLRRQHRIEIIVCDGGSCDQTPALAAPLADRVVSCGAGRARQMNHGASLARGEHLLFLHADTRLAGSTLDSQLATIATVAWGRFNVRLDSSRPIFRLIGWLMNRRSCLTSVATGDQALFVRTALFRQLGGYPPIALMEDIALSKLLRRQHRASCLQATVAVSVRYWEKHGIIHSIVRMWVLRAAYALGVPPATLESLYYR